MSLKALPVIPRTMRPSVAGTPVWYAEATVARTQLDIDVTIPTGPSRKLILLWGSDGGELPTAVTFDPAGVGFSMIPIDGAFGEEGNFRVAGYYLDVPPHGAKVVRIETANAVWSAASLKVDQNARAGLPQAEVSSSNSGATSVVLDETYLLDAFSISHDLLLRDGSTVGDVTPLDGQQAAGADSVVNASFLVTTSDRVHGHNGQVSVGWNAASVATQLQAVVNVLFSTGQIAADSFTPLSIWELDETSGIAFADSQGRSNASVTSGAAAGGAAPLLADEGKSLSVQGALISASGHVDWQVPNWTVEAYFQPRSLPSAGSNRPIVGKDSGLPVPGGLHLELYNDGGIGRIRAYIRDATGLAGTAIFVTSTTGDGVVALGTAHVVHFTYDDSTKTARVYLNRSLLATRTDQNFTGLQNNAAPISIGSRSGTPGFEQDGILDRVTLGAGVMTAAEIAARPAPTTITDPLAPGAITAVADSVGDVAPSTTTDVDVLANDTGKTGPHYDIEIVSNPAGRLSVINDQTASAKVRITTPAAPVGVDVNESGTYRVREGTSPTFGNPSNQASISWRRPGTGGGATFPFVTVSNPPLSHSGVSSRPTYNASDPRSASVIDPMSGLELFRVGGNTGSNVLINGSSSTGLVFPRILRNENLPPMQKVWNADGTLLMIDRRFTRSGDASNAASSYLIDANASHGASQPWRIIRAAGSAGLGDSGVGVDWFWDPLNPRRAYVLQNNGNIDEWWPVGGSGHAVGERNNLFNIPSAAGKGLSEFQSSRSQLHTSYDGRYFIAGCRETTGAQRWGGIRVDLIAGDVAGPFVPTPDTDLPQDRFRTTYMGSPSGLYGQFNSGGGNQHSWYNMATGQFVSFAEGMSHEHTCRVNGRDYMVGGHSAGSNYRMFDIAAGTYHTRATAAALPHANPQHTGVLAYDDLFETYGATGGGTSGNRYALFCRTNGRDGHPPGIMGVRMGLNDLNQIRYICHHRSTRSDNANEVHPHADPDFSHVVFSSNWAVPSGNDDGQCHPYVVVIPEAWHNPNNSGS
jgi:hypothetical protein